MNLAELKQQLNTEAPEYPWKLDAISKDKMRVRIVNHEGTTKEYSTRWVVEKCEWNSEGTAFRMPKNTSEF